MTKRALLVAINDYPGQGSDLRGCVHDMHDTMIQLLVQRRGVRPEDIRLVTDGRATAAGIKDRVEHWLRPNTGAGDAVLFAMSSHGARQTFRGSDGALVGTHEGLVPVDFAWDDEGRWISDAWVRWTFGDPAWAADKIVYLDACHSGGMDRGLGGWARTLLGRERRARCLTAPVDLAWRGVAAAEGAIAVPTGFALLAACQAAQTAADAYINGAYQGAWTWAWDQAVRRTPDARMDVLVTQAGQILARAGYAQQPRGEGALARAFM